MRRVNGNQMKFFMAMLMTLAGLQPFMPANLAMLYDLLAKTAVAWFAFAASEGVVHTADLYRYAARLYIAAAVMFLGNSILNTGFGMSSEPVSDNAFLTIALGVSAMGLYRSAKKYSGFAKAFRVLLTVSLAFCGCMCQYGYIMIPVMFISLMLRENPQKRDGCLIILSILLLISNLFGGAGPAGAAAALASKGDFLFILVVPFIRMYDGKRGSRSPVIKWAFYVYYPILIWLINIAVNMGS